MSDSSDDEDLSRFRDAVDSSFSKLIDESRGKVSTVEKEKLRSERYLDEATHYNDVKVSEELQKRIGAKVSEVINKNIEFVDIPNNKVKKRKIKGGVKLFRDSVDFLSCEEEEIRDVFTEIHNKSSRKIKNVLKRRNIDNDVIEPDEQEKLNSVAVSGDSILLKDDKYCKSRRKPKLFEYKVVGKRKNNLILNEINNSNSRNGLLKCL